MDKWQYANATVLMDTDEARKNAADYVGNLGADGWELVSANLALPGQILWFRRKIEG